jgi:methylmalonyl-CoA mutase
MVVVGGVTAQDYHFLDGAVCRIWTRNKISEAAIKILEILMGSFE